MIQLFREGTAHVYKGITCETKIVEPIGYQRYLVDGWIVDPYELYKEVLEEDPEKTYTLLKTAGD